MNRLSKWVGLSLAAFGMAVLPACDNFGDLNVNPTEADQIDPDFKITDIELRISGERYENWRANLIYSSTMMQHLAALPTYWSGDKYLYNAGYSSSLWDRNYANVSKNIEDLLLQVCDDPEQVNYCSTGRVLRVFMYHRLTDIYGDVPYSEAGRGFIDGNTMPAYDAQEDIYRDMLKELEEAGDAFDASKATPDGDLIYDGDVAKWQRFANSMMLRLGMRLSKVDPGLSQQWVQKAISRGVMTSNDDNAAVLHDPNGWRNGIGEVFDADGNQHLSDTFVQAMEDRADPRLTAYGSVPVAGAEPTGLPNGFNATTIQEHPSWVPCEGDPVPSPCGMDVYMDVNPDIVNFDDPMFFQTYAEVEFLLAEAAVRGWDASNPSSHYEAGVRAAMQRLSAYGGVGVADDAIDAYLAANPFDASSTEASLAQIGYEYWAATFLNEYETFANWRRTGYPELTPTNYPGNETGGTIPRRLRYNEAEAVSNPENYNAAVSRQGPDLFTTRVWWDS